MNEKGTYIMKDSEIVTPLIYNLVEYPDYAVHKKTGNIYSRKTGEWVIVKSKSKGKNKYPSCGLWLKTQKGKAIYTHIAVCETLKGNPTLETPPGITKKLWKTILSECEDSFMDWLRQLYQVNHINHDTTDYTPSNLEWATRQQNSQAFFKHAKKQGIKLGMEPTISNEIKDNILVLINEGKPYSYISKQYNVSKSTVCRVKQKTVLN